MRVFQLRQYDLPDVGDHLIHFTGRSGSSFDVPAEIRRLDPPDRLAQILHDGTIRAFPTFGTSYRPIVAFTESSEASVRRLITDRRYEPFGVGFSKQFIFDQGGGPVLYVRGDEWSAATGALPGPLRARLVRFWPGAERQPGDPLGALDAPQLPDHLRTASEWLHEREWRVPHDVAFAWTDVKFLLVPTPVWAVERAQAYGAAYGEEYAEHFRTIPVVAIDPSGELLHDESGIWGTTGR
jgi:hypothetical protein